MTVSSTYTAIHQACAEAAHQHRTRPLHARIALAIHQSKGSTTTTRKLIDELAGSPQAIRCAVARMVHDGWVDACGQLTLTAKGTALARSVSSMLKPVQTPEVVAEQVTGRGSSSGWLTTDGGGW